MEENNNFWHRSKLENELAKDYWGSLAGLVEEDSEALSSAERDATKSIRETNLAIWTGRNKMRSGKAILSFGKPLLLFAKSPQQ
jgi:hypothetical protein